VLVLAFLIILTVTSLAFLRKVTIGANATGTRIEAMKVHYLATSAANHAAWRLLNDPGFSAAENVYTMHDQGDGRYGYKVRRPTLTTFGTVATVGADGTAVNQQSYVHRLKPSNILSAYGQQFVATPKYTRHLGAAWSDVSDATGMGPNMVHWMELK